MNKKVILALLTFSVSCFTFAQKLKITEATVIQDNNYSGPGNGNEEILHIRIVAAKAPPASLQSLQINMEGTTDIHDVEEVKVYQKFTGAPFDARHPLRTAHLRGTGKPQNGNFAIALCGQLHADTTHLIIAYHVKETAREGNRLDASVLSLTADNQTYPFEAGNPQGFREILLRRTLVYAPGDNGSTNYRIPAITTAQDGSLVIITDKRKYNSVDLPEDIDVVANRSTDGGKTWSEPFTIAQGQGKGKGYGDALIIKAASGKLLTLFVGGPGLWGSTAGNPNGFISPPAPITACPGHRRATSRIRFTDTKMTTPSGQNGSAFSSVRDKDCVQKTAG